MLFHMTIDTVKGQGENAALDTAQQKETNCILKEEVNRVGH
jgi:hypothetical protein